MPLAKIKEKIMSENMEEELRNLREEKDLRNATDLINLFKKEIELEGAKIWIGIDVGNVPKIYIDGQLSTDLQDKINSYVGKYNLSNFL